MIGRSAAPFSKASEPTIHVVSHIPYNMHFPPARDTSPPPLPKASAFFSFFHNKKEFPLRYISQGDPYLQSFLGIHGCVFCLHSRLASIGVTSTTGIGHYRQPLSAASISARTRPTLSTYHLSGFPRFPTFFHVSSHTCCPLGRSHTPENQL